MKPCTTPSEILTEIFKNKLRVKRIQAQLLAKFSKPSALVITKFDKVKVKLSRYRPEQAHGDTVG